jgi:hypothetical protein
MFEASLFYLVPGSNRLVEFRGVHRFKEYQYFLFDIILIIGFNWLASACIKASGDKVISNMVSRSSRVPYRLIFSQCKFAAPILVIPMPGNSDRMIFPSLTFIPSNRSLSISRLPSRSAQSASGDN